MRPAPRARWVQLPDAPWSRRVIGGLANELASARRGRPMPCCRPTGRGGYVVSLRAPQNAPRAPTSSAAASAAAVAPAPPASTICPRPSGSASSPNWQPALGRAALAPTPTA